MCQESLSGCVGSLYNTFRVPLWRCFKGRACSAPRRCGYVVMEEEKVVGKSKRFEENPPDVSLLYVSGAGTRHGAAGALYSSGPARQGYLLRGRLSTFETTVAILSHFGLKCCSNDFHLLTEFPNNVHRCLAANLPIAFGGNAMRDRIAANNRQSGRARVLPRNVDPVSGYPERGWCMVSRQPIREEMMLPALSSAATSVESESVPARVVVARGMSSSVLLNVQMQLKTKMMSP